jgi:RyR and IP3R Homology associated
MQLLAENHNLNLQKTLNDQKGPEGKSKPKSINVVIVLAGMFSQMLKVINSVTINIGH